MSQHDSSTILPFGANKGKALRDVSADYFLWMIRTFREDRPRWIKLALNELLARKVLTPTPIANEFEVIHSGARNARERIKVPMGAISDTPRSAIPVEDAPARGMLPHPGPTGQGNGVLASRPPTGTFAPRSFDLPRAEVEVEECIEEFRPLTQISFRSTPPTPSSSSDDVERGLFEDPTSLPPGHVKMVLTCMRQYCNGSPLIRVKREVLDQLVSLYGAGVEALGELRATMAVECAREAINYGSMVGCYPHSRKGSLTANVSYLDCIWVFLIDPYVPPILQEVKK